MKVGSEVTVCSCTVVFFLPPSVKKYHSPVAPPLAAIAMGFCQTPRRAGDWRMPERVLPTTLGTKSQSARLSKHLMTSGQGYHPAAISRWHPLSQA